MKNEIRQILRLKNDTWYSNKAIKIALINAYKSIGIENKAKAADITLYYNAVKRQQRNGLEQVNGYYII